MLGNQDNHFLSVLEGLIEYRNAILIVVLSLALGLGGFYSYSYYKENIEIKAHGAFVECMQYFDAKVGSDKSKNPSFDDTESFDTAEQKWVKVIEIFKDSYEKHKASSLAPMFLVYSSEALINVGKLAEAIELLEKAIPDISSQELKQSYLLKLALMKLDSNDLIAKEEGLQLVHALTDEYNFADLVRKISKKISISSKINYVQDAALYRLGEYYWYKKNFNIAKNYWNDLVLKYGKETSSSSSWAALASEKLKFVENT